MNIMINGKEVSILSASTKELAEAYADVESIDSQPSFKIRFAQTKQNDSVSRLDRLGLSTRSRRVCAVGIAVVVAAVVVAAVLVFASAFATPDWLVNATSE